MIEWDGVCISRMGGHGGPPLRTKPVNAGRPNAREKCGLVDGGGTSGLAGNNTVRVLFSAAY